MNTETTETKRTPRNVVFLLKGDEGNEQIVKSFRAGDMLDGEDKAIKSPKRALTRYLSKVAQDETHELHQPLVEGQLKQAAGHPQTIQLTTKSVVS